MTFFLPENIESGDIYAVELTANGREAARVKCVQRLQVLDWPEVRMCREVKFTPVGKGKFFRLEAQAPRKDFILQSSRNNLLVTGNFENEGWWFDNANPAWKYAVGGRGGGRTLQFDTRAKNTGKHISAGTYPTSLLKLKDPNNLPALVRVFVRTIAGAGNGDGITIRMRTWDTAGKFSGDYTHAWTVQGEAGKKWVEHRRLFTEPLKAEADRLEVYLCNLAPQDGVCFQFDDFEVLPAMHIAPVFQVVTPEEEVYGGSDYTVEIRCGAVPRGKSGVAEVTLPVRKPAGEMTEVGGLMRVGGNAAAAGQGKVTLKFTKAEGRNKVLEKNAQLSPEGLATISAQLPEGEYKALVTVEVPGGKTFTREWICTILEDPFAM
ncbi:MAG: hypothetical protein J6S21_01755 [Victivallales bacterium]|nr:hypothetical protein [Victivallales bacterium]